jgi:hypothetical protein
MKCYPLGNAILHPAGRGSQAKCGGKLHLPELSTAVSRRLISGSIGRHPACADTEAPWLAPVAGWRGPLLGRKTGGAAKDDTRKSVSGVYPVKLFPYRH